MKSYPGYIQINSGRSSKMVLFQAPAAYTGMTGILSPAILFLEMFQKKLVLLLKVMRIPLQFLTSILMDGKIFMLPMITCRAIFFISIIATEHLRISYPHT